MHRVDRPDSIYAPDYTPARREPWMDDAACTPTTAPLFFSLDPYAQQLAKAICRTCPVLAECDQRSEGEDTGGIWAGRLHRDKTAAAPSAKHGDRYDQPPAPPAPKRLTTGDPCPVTDGDWTCPNTVHAHELCQSHRQAQLRGRPLRKFAHGGYRVKGQQAAA